MRKTTSLGVASVLVLTGLLGVASPAAAKAVPFAATGSIACSYTRLVLKITPGLTDTPTVQSMTLKGRATCTGSTGRAGVVLRSVKVSSTVNDTNPITCSDLFGYSEIPAPPALGESRMQWNVRGGKILDSHVSFPAYGLAGGSFVVPYPGTDPVAINHGDSYGDGLLSSQASGLHDHGWCNKNGIKRIDLAFASFRIDAPGG